MENYKLYIKLWNNAANVILTDENNVILDSMYRRPEKNEVTGELYSEPTVDETKFESAEEKFPVRQWNNEDFNSFNAYIEFIIF